MEAIYNIPAVVKSAWSQVPISRETPQNIINFAKHYFQNLTIASIKENKWTYVLGSFLIVGLIYKIHKYILEKTTLHLTTKNADLQSKMAAGKLALETKEKTIEKLQLQLTEQAAGQSGDLVVAAQRLNAVTDLHVSVLKNKHNVDFDVVAELKQQITKLSNELATYQHEIGHARRLEKMVDLQLSRSNTLQDGAVNDSSSERLWLQAIAGEAVRSPDLRQDVNPSSVESDNPLEVSVIMDALDLAGSSTPNKKATAARLLLGEIQKFSGFKNAAKKPPTRPSTPAGDLVSVLGRRLDVMKDTPQKTQDELNISSASWNETPVDQDSAAKTESVPESVPTCNLDEGSVENKTPEDAIA